MEPPCLSREFSHLGFKLKSREMGVSSCVFRKEEEERVFIIRGFIMCIKTVHLQTAGAEEMESDSEINI